MTLEQFPLEPRRCGLGAEERSQHRIGELLLGDRTDQFPTNRHGRTGLREEQGIVVARVHRRDHGQEPRNLVWVKAAGSFAIIVQAITPSPSRLISTNIPFEPNRQQLGCRRLDYLLGVRPICSR